MNDKRFNEGIKSIKKIKLKNEENDLLYKNILNYVDNNPVQQKPTVSPYGPFWFINVFNRTSFLVIIIFLIFGGVGVFAAEKSLPGDLLYPIKVRVNEPIVDAVTFGKISKANREVEKASKRLEEAENLASQGRLNEESRKEVEILFNKHTEKINDLVEKNIEENKEKIDSSEVEINTIKNNFEDEISKHTENLEKIKEKLSEKDKKDEVETLKNNILIKVKERKDREDFLDKKENVSTSTDKGRKDNQDDSSENNRLENRDREDRKGRD